MRSLQRNLDDLRGGTRERNISTLAAERLPQSGFAIGCGGLSDMGKDFIFRNYVWIAVAGEASAIAAIYQWVPSGRIVPIGTTLGAVLALCFIVQKQKLEELRLFRDLFTDFNHRYDDMNEELEDVHAGKQMGDSNLRITLVDYFNLCAEEYLFYKEGFIHTLAWRSWCLGMLYYLKDERVRKIWDDEVRKDSYYGLTFEIIEAGARLT
jgi:hypothetical protein